MKLVILTFATKNYCYALGVQARRVLSNLQHCGRKPEDTHFIFVTDDSKEGKEAYTKYCNEIGSYATTTRIEIGKVDDTKVNYQTDAQILIARMQTAGMDAARKVDADYCWSLESDVIPPSNALRCLLQTLEFDDSYYNIAMVTYPSQGGGPFLGGRGTPAHPIAEDYTAEERILPEELKKQYDEMKAEEKTFRTENKPFPTEWIDKARAINDEARKCPPSGNVWKLNAEFGWRRRGWFDSAYPAIGRGAILPTDWVGMGCTMLSKRALQLANFEGYEGKGTQDLFLCWHRWYPAGLRMAVISHILCDHIVRARDKEGRQSHTKYVHCLCYHETDGECVGHPRMRYVPWLPLDGTDDLSSLNDGKVSESPKKEEDVHNK